MFFLLLFICIHVDFRRTENKAQDQTTKEKRQTREGKRNTSMKNQTSEVVRRGGSRPETSVNCTFLFRLTAG